MCQLVLDLQARLGLSLHGDFELIIIIILCCLRSSSPILSPIDDITVLIVLICKLLPPFAKVILLRCSETRVLISIIISWIYSCLYLVMVDGIFFTFTYGSNGLGITDWNLWRCSQIEKICGKFKILLQLHITNNMVL